MSPGRSRRIARPVPLRFTPSRWVLRLTLRFRFFDRFWRDRRRACTQRHGHDRREPHRRRFPQAHADPCRRRRGRRGCRIGGCPHPVPPSALGTAAVRLYDGTGVDDRFAGRDRSTLPGTVPVSPPDRLPCRYCMALGIGLAKWSRLSMASAFSPCVRSARSFRCSPPVCGSIWNTADTSKTRIRYEQTE